MRNISQEDIKEVAKLFTTGIAQSTIAKKLGTSRQRIHQIVYGLRSK